jgi:DNA polymerase III subunit beta
MDITINSQVLATELRILNKVVPAKPVIQILSSALFHADDGLTAYATDLEVGLNITCAATIHEPGTAALPVAKLLALVEQFPDAPVRLEANEQRVCIRSGAFKSQLQLNPLEDFPQCPAVEGAAMPLDAGVLRTLIGKTRYAVTVQRARYVLQGALLVTQGITSAMVATDTKRLALATSHHAELPPQKVLIPAKTLDVLFEQAADVPIMLTVGPRHLFFDFGSRLLVSRMIDGEFPSYERVIPQQNDLRVIFDRAAFIATLRRLLVLSEETQAVYCELNDNKATLYATSVGVGFGDEVLPVAYGDRPVKICINGAFILDFLTVATERTITMALKDEVSAVLLTDGNDHLAVIMPMRG